MKQIFPKEIVEHTVEAHQFKHSTHSKIIYTVVLLFIMLSIASLPFVEVDVYSSARGIIKSTKDRFLVNSIHSGKVALSFVENNKQVKKGDTLIMYDNFFVNEKITLINQQIEALQKTIDDLNYLLYNKRLSVTNFQSSKYRKEFLLLQQNKIELNNKYKLAKQNFDRNYILFEKKVIPKVDFEKINYEYNSAKNKLSQLIKQQNSKWEAELMDYKDNLLQLKSSKNQQLKNKEQLTLTSPIAGTLLNVKGITKSSFLAAGDLITEISPNTELRAESYISPSDIGLLKVNTRVSFLVDAFNYNQWGTINGKIIEISDDIELVDNRPMFKVLCSLDEKKLYLKNGFEGNLKKGMTLNTQFKIANRSLFDLLYDKTYTERVSRLYVHK